MIERTVRTLIVLQSQVMARADGRVAIRLDTQQESIALELDLDKIELLRRELAQAETLLRQRSGKASH